MFAGDFLASLGVRRIEPRTVPFDPGYDLHTVTGHLEQSAHLMAGLKLSMACWMVGSRTAIRSKLDACRRAGVATVTGGGPFEIAAAQGRLEDYLDLCASLGVQRIEAGEGFTDLPLSPGEVARMASSRQLELQFELGKKHGGTFTGDGIDTLIEQGRAWLGAGAVQLVVEARESAAGVGVFDGQGRLDGHAADRFASAFGLGTLVFEAPAKQSQFALIDHFGPEVVLGNVRLEEVLRVEIYRRGLHSDAFGHPRLRPSSLDARQRARTT